LPQLPHFLRSRLLKNGREIKLSNLNKLKDLYYCWTLPFSSNDLHFPSGAIIPFRWKWTVPAANNVRFEPAMMALSHFPDLIAWNPCSRASNDEEHAVSKA